MLWLLGVPKLYLNSVKVHCRASLGLVGSQIEFGVIGRKKLLQRLPQRQQLVPLGVLGKLSRIPAFSQLPHDRIQLQRLLLQLHQPDVLRVADLQQKQNKKRFFFPIKSSLRRTVFPNLFLFAAPLINIAGIWWHPQLVFQV